ncbi:MAG TPA: FAD-dependent oxidoreductase [Bacteroidia bacterium]|nr:FAD-dependent oxidoreductase [Bacteroidia bacterium]
MKEKNPDQKLHDVIIVGSGIAGSLLSYFLVQQNLKVLVFNQEYERSASRVAVGIVKPITGRRLAKSWNLEQFLPFAHSFYKNLEKELQFKFYFPIPNLELCSNVKQLNEWISKSGEPDYKAYIKGRTEIKSEWGIQNIQSSIRIAQTFHVNVASLCASLMSFLSDQLIIKSESFDHTLLQINSDHIQYSDLKSKLIVFCEGGFVQSNPFFKDYPFQNVKGDVLHIQHSTLPQEYILSKGIFIVPIGNHQFKVGSTYNWKANNDLPDNEARQELETKLKRIIGDTYSIIKHEAGYRPSIKERRPIIGFHPVHHCLGIFNGLGSKGVLMAPYMAQHFAKVICKIESLDQKFNLQQFDYNS